MTKIQNYTLGLDMGTNFMVGLRRETQPMSACEIWYMLGFAPVKPNLIFRYDNTEHNDFS